MDIYVPDYYESFRCIGSECRDNCCIGWEIDIDKASLEKYMTLPGSLGDELRANITRSEDGSDCFVLAKNDRCPFLNDDNLCRLILAGGEAMLCEICDLHPRFRNWFGDRCETGIGLCCEEAARMIINSDIPFGLHILRSDEEECEPMDSFHSRLLDVRAELFEIIRCGNDISHICEKILLRSAEAEGELSGSFPKSTAVFRSRDFYERSVSLLSSLEPVNDLWKDVCGRLSSDIVSTEYKNPSGYKNILSYFIFRHFMNSGKDSEIFLKAALAVFSLQMIAHISECCGLSLEESAVLWSKETEYSTDDLELIYDHLYELYYQ